MLKSKLLRVFRTLDSSQRLAFRKAVRSSYFNKRPDLIALWDYLEAYENTAHAFEKAAVFAAIFPQTDYDNARLRHVMSFLLKLIEELLIVEELDRNPHLKARFLARAYRQMGLDPLLEESLRNAKTQLEAQPLRDSGYWHHAYRWEFEYYSAIEQQERDAKRNFQALNNALDIQYIAEKLKQGCILQAHQAVYKTQYDLGLLPFVLSYVEQTPHLIEVAAVGIYYHYYKAINTSGTPSADHFSAFRAMLDAHLREFAPEELHDLYVLAINYGIRQINNTMSTFYMRETLALYNSGLASGYLLDKGVLSRFSFKNALSIALRLGEFDWTWEFIDRYQVHLEPMYRDTYTHYGLSKWYFTQRRYKEAMLRLQQVDYEDIFLNLDAKIMLLKIYYEIAEYEVLDSFLASFKTFLHRKRKLLSYHQENYLNIINIVRKLLAVRPFDKSEKAALRQYIEQTKILTEREWLLEQLNKLGKSA